VERPLRREEPAVFSKTVKINGLNIFYPEGCEPSRPTLVILHGSPTSSHQYRNLLPALAGDFHVVAPSDPGFGNSDMPEASSFAYTFNNLAGIVEGANNDVLDVAVQPQYVGKDLNL
jgi:pimeloyl-ACP methyl ester carboxylesterase